MNDLDNVDDLLRMSGSLGEIRRLTLLFADLVDSTELSIDVSPETYRTVVGRYRSLVLESVNAYGGHIRSIKGEGTLAVFGHPVAHENDAYRAVAAGLRITHEVEKLSRQAARRFGVDIDVRVGVHRGWSYLDLAEDDVYGLAPNLTARVATLAEPGSVAVSESVAPLVHRGFELQSCRPAPVKGIDGLITHFRVVGESVQPPRVGSGPLVGRDRERTHVIASWSDAQAQALTTPGVVFAGESGVGKSRMAAVAADLAEAADAVVLELVGSPLHGPLQGPLHNDVGPHPVRALIERRCGIGRLDAPGQRLRLLEDKVANLQLDAKSTVPLLASALGITAGHGYTEAPGAVDGSNSALADVVEDFLLACLGNRPGLVIAEDAHWFDQLTLGLVGAVMKAAEGRHLVIVTGRDGDWLRDDWPATVFDLPPLSDDQSAELITALDSGLSTQLRAEVLARCDGIPLYIEQVVADVGAVGHGVTREIPDQLFGGPTVPDALYEPLFACLVGSANVRPVLQAAAAIGRYVELGLLRAAVDMTDGELDDVIAELEGGSGAAAVLESSGTDCWRFRRELLREVAAELSPPSLRRALHSRVADALVGRDQGALDWSLVAAHYERAERFDEAVLAYERASAHGDRPKQVVDYLSAAS